MKLFISFILLGILSWFSVRRQSEAEEYNLKAAFIYNFTKFIEWDTLLHEQEFKIGILGDSPILRPLDEIAKIKTARGKKITLRKYNSPDELGFCNIIFISKQFSLPLNSILKKISPKGSLLVSEEAGYAKLGVAINFVVINDKVKFEANPKVMDSSGLRASSQLLKLAIIVDE